jgi:hypothetical protein
MAIAAMANVTSVSRDSLATKSRNLLDLPILSDQLEKRELQSMQRAFMEISQRQV